MTAKDADPARVYVVTDFVVGLSFALAWTLLGLYYVQVAGLTPLQLLLVGAALEASALVLEVPTGVVADVYSRRLSVILGFVFLGLGMIVTGLFASFAALLLAQVVCALGYAFLSGAHTAWLTDEVGEERAAQLFLLASQYERVGSILGIALAAGLARVGLNVPLLVAGGVLLVLALYLKVVMPEHGFTPLPREERRSWKALTATLRQGLAGVRRSTVLTLLMLAALLYGASSEAFDRLKDFLLLKETTLPAGISAATLFAGLALASHLIGYAVTEPLRRRVNPSDLRQAARAVQGVVLLSVALLLAFAYAPGFWWAASALVLFGVVRGLYGPLYAAWLNRGLESRSRATVNSLAAQADALGQVSFGPLFGLIGNLSGVRVALALAALVRLSMLPVIGQARRGQQQD